MIGISNLMIFIAGFNPTNPIASLEKAMKTHGVICTTENAERK
jgi:hypothetical protein